MDIITQHAVPLAIPHWPETLSTLVRDAWTGDDGRCHFPYRPLTTPEFWETAVAREWTEGRMHSWVAMLDGRAVAHAALVRRDGYWEAGRLVSREAPPGTVAALCETRMAFAEAHGLSVVAECTQAHTRAQFFSAKMGMRFAGIGILAEIDGVSWDIVYFDNHPAEPFNPEPGILANPLGHPLVCEPRHRKRLAQIPGIIASNARVQFPPTRFNVLPHLVDPVLRIVALNAE